jgi:SAM-dependent methyltransferase
VSAPERARNTVFGEVANLYHESRPSYPDAVFDAVCAFGSLRVGDRALEIGAGTGKATLKWLARGLDVVALEPSPGMADVLAGTGVRVVATTFEAWNVEPAAFRLVTAAQAWHWVTGDDRFAKAAHALEPGGVLALLWNKPRDFDGPLGAAVDAVYRRVAPALAADTTKSWNLEANLDDMRSTPELRDAELRGLAWTQEYTTAEYVRLLGTHSDHRMLPDEQRTALHTAVGEVVDAYGGRVEVVYDVSLFLARRA